jgi:hypothetical protein
MRIRHLLGLTFLALFPITVWGQVTPEQMLSAGNQFYIRWDGVKAHQAAHARTAVGQMLAGDTGVFLTGLYRQVQEGIGTLLTVEQLLGGAPPETLQQMQADSGEAAKLLPLLAETGFILAGELRNLEPFDGDLLLILPDLGDKAKPLVSTLRLIVNLSKGKMKEHKFGNRVVTHVEGTEDLPLHLTWWVEAGHGIIHLGAQPPQVLMKRWDDKGLARLTENALYKRIKGFNQFPTSARAFIDIAAFAKLARTRGPEVARVIDELGVDGLKNLVLYSGFAGDAERGLVELEMPGPRKGVLGLFRGKTFKLGDVPALPPDVVSWSMISVDPTTFYDVSLQTAEAIMRVLAPDQAAVVKSFPALVNLALGLDLRNDLLAALDDQMVGYTAPSEGPLTLGQVVLLKVKDGDKVKESVEQIIKAIARLASADVQLKKRTYRGVELREVRVRAQGFIFVPSYAIHKGWLCVGLFPQPVQGFISRSNGEMAAWKPSAKVRELLDQMPKEALSISYSDPRPTLKQLLSLGPIIGGAVVSFNPETSFEVSSIPNAQEVTRYLFPNVSVATGDDKFVRIESRASLPLPLDLAGIDTYGIFLLISFGRFL